MEKFIKLLKEAIELNCTDIHLLVNERPTVRKNTYLQRFDRFSPITKMDMEEIFNNIVTTANQKDIFNQNGSIDISYTLEDLGFFRLNFYLQAGMLALSVRILPNSIPAFDTLLLPPQVKNLVNIRNGLILVTGATSNGKSTTLASLINEINLNQSKHIITIEDPVEYQYPKGKSIISQREIGRDCKDFASALRAALRQDPDVIMVGEMRDKETIEIALTAAETGHLVLSTLHTNSSAATTERILSYFDANEINLISSKFASTFRAIISQNLIPKKDNSGLICAAEVLLPLPSIQSLIREGKSYQIYSMMQINKNNGIITMDESLAKLVKENKISETEALSRVQNLHLFQSYLKAK